MFDHLFYDLRQRYPGDVRLYYNREVQVNRLTGQSTQNKDVLNFKAVVAPTNVFRKFPRLPELHGQFNKSLKEVLIKEKHTLETPDYIVYGHERYDILSFQYFSETQIYSIVIAKADDSKPMDVFEEQLTQSLNFNNAYESEVV